MDPLEAEEYLDEGAVRLHAAIREAQLLGATEGLWAAVLEVERIRAEIEAVTGVSLIPATPPSVINAALKGAGDVTVAQLAKHLESSNPPE